MSHNVVGQGGRVSQSLQSAGTLYRLFYGAALGSACWGESSFRIMLKIKQKQSPSFQNRLDLHTVILVQITGMKNLQFGITNRKKASLHQSAFIQMDILFCFVHANQHLGVLI